jgi:DNA topoisomerase III
MEKYGIGTDASIATHIGNIIERAYVTVQAAGRRLIPTPLGYALAKGYCEIDPELVLPQVRSNIERSCELIAKGKADFNRVVDHVLTIFKKKLQYLKLNVGAMERILTIMLNTAAGDKSLECLSNKIVMSRDAEERAINFCNKCFKGHYCVDYHNKKGWGVKCNSCNFTIRCC